MMEKLGEVARHWHDQFASSLLFALVGIFIGIGQLLTGNERLTARLQQVRHRWQGLPSPMALSFVAPIFERLP